MKKNKTLRTTALLSTGAAMLVACTDAQDKRVKKVMLTQAGHERCEQARVYMSQDENDILVSCHLLSSILCASHISVNSCVNFTKPFSTALAKSMMTSAERSIKSCTSGEALA